MAYQKLQVSNGLAVIPSNTVRIPNPDTLVISGTDGNADTPGVFRSSAAGFLNKGILAGAIIYATDAGGTTRKAYYVLSVDSNTALNVSVADGVIAGSTTVFQIYNQASPGCILFVGVAGDMSIQLAQQNGNANTTELMFKGIAAGSFMPTQSIRVGTSSTATDIIALW